MPTTAERHALAFLTGVALLGGGARAWSSYHEAGQSGVGLHDGTAGATASAESVGDQLAAIDLARASKRGARGKGRGGQTLAAGPRGGRTAFGRSSANDKLKPPTGRAPGEGLRGSDIVVDADVATVTQLQMLPRISAALAERIIANRDSFGAFGALSALGRVCGMSADIRNEIRNLVVFTGLPRAAPLRASRRGELNGYDAPRQANEALRQPRVTGRTKKRN